MKDKLTTASRAVDVLCLILSMAHSDATLKNPALAILLLDLIGRAREIENKLKEIEATCFGKGE